jgi:hypothetical protein
MKREQSEKSEVRILIVRSGQESRFTPVPSNNLRVFPQATLTLRLAHTNLGRLLIAPSIDFSPLFDSILIL